MATLYNTKISATYPGLIKTTDNAALTATLKELTDGSGNASGLYVNNAGDFKVNAILEWGSLKDTGTGVTITQWVTAADGIENFNNNTSVPTSAAVKTYVDAVVTASDLDFLGDTNTGTPAVDLDSQNFSIIGTTNEIVTSGAAQTLTIGLPNSVVISGTFTGTTFAGDLNGTINTATTAFTQIAGTSNQTVATTKFVMDLDSASDLDFSGDSGTGDVNLNTESLAITGTTNQIITAANLTGLSLSLPATVHRDLQGNVTGNVQGDLTGNVTATSVLADGVTATTQASSDSSEKIATTAYVKGLDNASDLDITGDTGTGDVNLNTQTLNILGTTNEITTAVVNQTATISLPSSISVDVIGNVTGDLTGNADTATAWETARDLSLTGQATATLSNVDGALAVSGAVTLDNNSVTAKVLTGLPTPSASSVLATDSIVEGIGKLQSQINGLANGLRFMGSWNVTTNVPPLSSGGGESASGTTTLTSANKLVDSDANFATVSVGDKVVNQVDGQTASVTNVDSSTILSIDADIMLSGEAYTIDISPFLTQGHYYVVSEGGARTLNSVTNWSVGDWAIVGANNEWTILDHTDVEGVGTPEYIPRWTTVGTIGDSIMVQGSNLITVNGTLSTTTNLNSGSNFAVNTDKFTANATTGAVAFEGGLAINTDKFTVNATSGNTVAAGTITAPTFIGNLTGNVAGNITGTVNATSILADGVTATTQSANDASTKVATTAYADTQAGLYLPLVGGTLTGDVTFDDDVIVSGNITLVDKTTSEVGSILLGNSNALQIFYDGSNSFVSDSGTGDLYVRSNSTAIIKSDITKIQAFGSSTDFVTINSTGATFAGNLTVDGTSTLTGNVDIGADNGLGGKLSIQTTSYGILQDMRTLVAGGVNPYLSIFSSADGITIEENGSVYKSLMFKTGGANALTIDSSGNSTFTGNVNVSGGVKVTGFVVPTGAGAEMLHISGSSLYQSYDRTNSVYLPVKLDGSTVDLQISGVPKLSIDSSGNVGIGTDSPDGALQVTAASSTTSNGNDASFKLYITNTDTTNNNYSLINFTDSDGGSSCGGMGLQYIDHANNYGDLCFITRGSGGYGERMRIDSSGNVGIGTDSPDLSLDVESADTTAFSGTGYRTAIFQSTSAVNADKPGIQLGYDTTGGGIIAPATQSGTTNFLGFWTYNSGWAERMRIDSSGNVGINAVPEGNWITTTNVLQIGKAAAFWGTNNSNNAYISNNMFVNTNGNNHSLYAGGAAQYRQSDNIHLWYTSNVASAGNEVITLTERMRIDSSGNVGIGNTNPSLFNQVGTAPLMVIGTGSNSPSLTLYGGTSSACSLAFADGTTTSDQYRGLIQYAHATDSMIFSSAAAERMRITSGGTLDVKANSNNVNGMTGIVSRMGSNCDNTTSYAFIVETGTANRCFIYGNGDIVNTNNSYGALSDERLKENIIDATPKLDDLMKVKVRNFSLKGDETKQIGVVAQELEEVFPSMINETKGSNPEDETLYKGVKYSVFVPILIKSIQELKAEVDLLKSNKCNCKN